MDVQCTTDTTNSVVWGQDGHSFMTDKIHLVRHKNARKILDSHCEGVVRKFAEALNKSERQCSNFLRLKNPATIGNKIAREIEFAFGYPNKWLDLDQHQDQQQAEYVDTDIIESFNKIEEGIKDISSKVLSGMEEGTALASLKRMQELHKRHLKLANYLAQEILTETREYLVKVCSNLGIFASEEPSRFCDLISNEAVFLIKLDNSILKIESNMAYMNDQANNIKRKYFDVHPILVDGDLRVVLLEHKADITMERMTKVERDIASLLSNKVEFSSKDLPEHLSDFIDTHPSLKQKTTIKT